jgi:hypothetical protein
MTIRIRDLAEELGLSLDYLRELRPELLGLADETSLTSEQVEAVRACMHPGPPFPLNAAVTQLSIGGFKAFGTEQSALLRPITLIFGPNSSGKSSLLHGLVWAYHAHITGDFHARQVDLSGENIDLGDFQNVVFRHRDKTPLRFGFLLHPRLLEYALELRRPLEVSLEISNQDIAVKEEPASDGLNRATDQSRIERQPRLTRLSYSCDGDQLLSAVYRAEEGRNGELQIEELNLTHPVWRALIEDIASVPVGNPFRADRLSLVRGVIEALLKRTRIESAGFNITLREFSAREAKECRENLSFNSPTLKRLEMGDSEWFEVSNDRIANFLNSFLGLTFGYVRNYLKSLRYLGPLRSYPERHFSFTKNRDRNWRAGGGECWDQLLKDRQVRDQVNNFLGDEKKLQTPYEFRTRRYEAPGATPIDDLFLMDMRTGTVVTQRDVGVGISQIVPVLVETLANVEQTILIEQPELHIHPALQAELGDLFIESALGSSRNRFILETHSEHLILRLLRRIRQSTEKDPAYPQNLPRIGAEDVSVIYAQPTKEGTKLIPLRITPDGDFADKWPNGFFTERETELF